ncbi:ChuX/HutX family heme-like substrate-binding protein [Labrenzia sp. CE80]|uniref:hemin-degrading factor n=1 Tax=Labrenzia sp. CE80 TaxID=1788986 RepID=UPI00129AE797|nr:ChuX/HutX family heme-like substrate-binding protein [Labrenzia sp. CE80]
MTEQFSKTDQERDGAQIRRMREQHSNMRDRDLANMLEISEAELLAAFCGHGVRRVAANFDVLFNGLKEVGEVMALTRNESAVHEKIGPFEKFVNGKRAALMLGEQIDMRMFPAVWAHGFAVERQDGEHLRRSLQFFDAAGEAVFKVHTRPKTNLEGWNNLIDKLLLSDQDTKIEFEEKAHSETDRKPASAEVGEALRQRWEGLTDPHQFHGMLKELDLHRLSALEVAGHQWAWKLDESAVAAMLHLAANEALPIMCFVGNKGCIQIHSGAIKTVMDKGPWINVLDPTFHLHLRTDHIASVWAVRKPADIEHVTSIEAYDENDNLIIQFFGVRKEGSVERWEWRDLIERLPQVSNNAAIGVAS